MGLQVSGYTILIPIRTIVLKYPGGWRQYWNGEFPGADGMGDVMDEYIVRYSSRQNQIDIALDISSLTRLGLQPYARKSGGKVFKDFAVVQLFGGMHYPCPWLYFDQQSGCGHYMESGLIFPSQYGSLKNY